MRGDVVKLTGLGPSRLQGMLGKLTHQDISRRGAPARWEALVDVDGRHIRLPAEHMLIPSRAALEASLEWLAVRWREQEAAIARVLADSERPAVLAREQVAVLALTLTQNVAEAAAVEGGTPDGASAGGTLCGHQRLPYTISSIPGDYYDGFVHLSRSLCARCFQEEVARYRR